MRYQSIAQGIAVRSAPEPNTGCWLWLGSLDKDGYGRLSWKNHACGAHRYSWMAFRGPIPEGMQIDHMCRVRSCVNPDHLRVVTPRQNVLENSLSHQARNAAKPHCPKCGGVWTTTHRGQIRRICRFCRRDASRRYEARFPERRRKGKWKCKKNRSVAEQLQCLDGVGRLVR